MDTFKIAQSCDVQKTQNNISDVARRCMLADLRLYHQYNHGRLMGIKIQHI